MQGNQDLNKILGGEESQVVVGVALYTVTGGLRGYAVTCRVDGTIISAISVQDEGGSARAYTPTWRGIALLQGDYFVSKFPIVSITLTAAADSVIVHCNKPY
jgi:hypothetical protein